MNLILIRGGYPPVAVRPEDRPAYLTALQQEQAGRGADAFNRLLYQRLDTTLGGSLSALKQALPAPPTPPTAPDGKPQPTHRRGA
jgi:hypothetical protein